MAPYGVRGKRILVTGGAGFIGSNLCRELIEQGATVYAVDNLITGKRQNIAPLLTRDRFRFFKIDITAQAFRRKFAVLPVDEIYHAACPTGVPNIERLGEEMLRTSSLGTFNVLELVKQHHAKLLFTSSCEVYGQPEVFPQGEQYGGNVNPTGPRSPYEEGKRFAESIVAAYVRKYQIRAKIVRFFNAYGPGMSLDDHRVIPRFLHSVALGEELTIYGDGQQTRTFCYVDDVIRALFLVMEKGLIGEVYNIGSDSPVSINQLAEILTRLTDHTKGVSYVPHFIEDHHGRQPSLGKIQALGWQQEILLEEGLRRMIAAHDLLRSTPAHPRRTSKDGAYV